MTNCVASPQATTVKLAEPAELTDPCPLANPHSYTERDVYAMEYFHWPAWVNAWL